MTLDAAAEQSLRELYAGCYPRLVAVVSAMVGSRHEAEEAVQEAFVRLVGVWDRVSDYDDPEAWLRAVAIRVHSNRRRKVRNGVRVQQRLSRSAVVGPPTGDAIDLSRALAGLPVNQRQVLVLHYAVDLSVAQISEELGVPPGTVTSRLSRGRQALASLLEAQDHGRV